MVILLAMGIFLVVMMMLQKSNKGLSSTIAGGTDTYFGQSNGDRRARILNILTIVVSIVFVIVVLAMFLFQPDYNNYVVGNEWQDVSNYMSQIKK